MHDALTVKHDVRLGERDSALLRKVADARRCTLSQLIREAILVWLARASYLDAEEKKALGIAVTA